MFTYRYMCAGLCCKTYFLLWIQGLKNTIQEKVTYTCTKNVPSSFIDKTGRKLTFNKRVDKRTAAYSGSDNRAESENESPERWVDIQCESACQIQQIYALISLVSCCFGDRRQSPESVLGENVWYKMSPQKSGTTSPEGYFPSAVLNKKHSFPSDLLPAP